MLRFLGCCALILCVHSSNAQEKDRGAKRSPRAEAAIKKGLAYLAKNQNKDGSWGTKNQVAVTALTLRAFASMGHLPEQEPHGEMLAKGLNFLLKQSRPSNGYLGAIMYEHGFAMLALTEVGLETSRADASRAALISAVAVLVKGQTVVGGWGYQPDPMTDWQDVSITMGQLMALAAAKKAGIEVPNDTFQRAIQFVRSCQSANGTFGYRKANESPFGSAFARTAGSVAVLLTTGKRDSDEVKRGLKYLQSLGDAPFQPRYPWFYYGQYYAAQALFLAGEKDFEPWYAKISDALVQNQDEEGAWRGGLPAMSVPPRFKVEAGPNGYCTPMAILILASPYRQEGKGKRKTAPEKPLPKASSDRIEEVVAELLKDQEKVLANAKKVAKDILMGESKDAAIKNVSAAQSDIAVRAKALAGMIEKARQKAGPDKAKDWYKTLEVLKKLEGNLSAASAGLANRDSVLAGVAGAERAVAAFRELALALPKQ